jgi:LmbE family N-acetylglucosaminyl deacetylase
MPRRPVILGVFAHPDDESFALGGTLARYAAEGAAVHIIIATDGIAGSVGDPSDLANHDTLAQVRSTELSNAIVTLGATSVWSLPYRDSGMRGSADNDHPEAFIRQPVEQVVQELLGYFRRLQPDVVITHDPYGGYGHPDHIRACEATTAAFHVTRAEAAGQPDGGRRSPQKLYYTAFPKDMVRFFVRVGRLTGRDMTKFGRNQDINLVEIATWDTPVHTRIDVAAYLPAKERASIAHASQYSGGPSWLRAIPGPLRSRFTRYESFTCAFPAPGADIESDLLAGVAAG